MDDEDRRDLIDQLTAAREWALPAGRWADLKATLQSADGATGDAELLTLRRELRRIAPRRITRGLSDAGEPPTRQPIPPTVRDLVSRLIGKLGTTPDDQDRHEPT